MRVVAFLMVLAAWNCAVAQQASSECAPPVAQPAVASAAPCPADDTGCADWRRFRAQHPFPYQSIALSVSSDSSRATVVVSEPPPLAERARYAELFRAAFQVPTEAIRRMRYQVGVDGWLEDWVISLPLSGRDTLSLPGPDANPIVVPIELASKLEFIGATLFGTRIGFYVEAIGPASLPQLPVGALPNLQVTAGDLSRLSQEKRPGWNDLTPGASGQKTFGEASAFELPSTLVNPNSGIVMLVIPPGTRLTDVRAEFRKFAVASDYLVGALKPKRGGLLMFGRSRSESLAVLPPLRFETLQSLAESLGQPLGQSYERQRIFAGKIGSGAYEGWDWAPIYLSKQLQDSEFGTLLNIADQQLKSWSECSRVHYAGFEYPSPSEFPFGKLPASTWVMQRALSTSLIFNWNTNGFAAVSDSPQGRVVSSVGTTALPVSYIVPDDSQSKAVRMRLQARQDRDKTVKSPIDVATSASNVGSQYFATRGDPILARVAQNVFLYQILGEAKPFAAVGAGAAAVAKAVDRSDIVSKLLVTETTPWLTAMLGSPNGVKVALAEGAPATDLHTAMQRAGVTAAQLSELLATPQYQAQRMLTIKSDVDLKIASFSQFEERWNVAVSELKEAYARSEAAFRTHCASFSGSVSTVKEKGTTFLRCDWRAPVGASEPPFVDPAAKRIAELKDELEAIKRESVAVESDVEAKSASLTTLAAQNKLAEAVGAELRSRATDTKDLDAVFLKILAATAQAESRGSIQTPSVVLSQNVAETDSVGGHNIDGLPWDVQAAATKAGSGLRWIGGRPTVAVSKEQAGNSVRDDLAGAARGRNVLFAGFPVERAVSIAEGAEVMSRSLPTRAQSFEDSISTARKYFAGGMEALREMFSLRTKSGKVVHLSTDVGRSVDGVIDRGRLVATLAERPTWAEAKVLGNKPTAESGHLVEVRYGRDQGVKISVRNKDGLPVSTDPTAAVASSKAALASAERDQTDVQEAITRVAERLYRDNKSARFVDAFLEGVGKSAFRFDLQKGQVTLVAAGE